MEPNSEPHHGCKRWKEKTERGENQYRVRVNLEACWRKKKSKGDILEYSQLTRQQRGADPEESGSELLMQNSN